MRACKHVFLRRYNKYNIIAMFVRNFDGRIIMRLLRTIDLKDLKFSKERIAVDFISFEILSVIKKFENFYAFQNLRDVS